MAAEPVLEIIKHPNHIREIRLSRPAVANRFDGELHVAFTKAVDDLAAEDAVRCIVLSSVGTVFSAGGDFELMEAALADETVRHRILDEGRELLRALLDVPQPLVAALHGPAIGLGATVVAACDVVVAARSAFLADTHVAIGLVAGDGGALVWPGAVGMTRASRYLLTGDRLPADLAHQFGLITDLVDEPESALPEALAIAGRIAANAPLAVRGTKRALAGLRRARAAEVVELALQEELITLGSSDLREGIDAFRGRRAAVFTGKL